MRLALVALGMVLALGLVEVALRLTLSPDEVHRHIGSPTPAEAARWVDHPFLPFVGRPHADYVVTVPVGGEIVAVNVRNNSYGFRSHEFTYAKMPEDYFILALGESTTWGAAAESNAATWPELLETRLRARYPERNVRVFNLGTQNATVAYNVVVLALIGTHLRPDLVIAYHGFNDFAPATARGYRTDQSHFYSDLALEHRWHGFQKSLPRAFLASYAVALFTSLADDAIQANRLSFYVERPIQPNEDTTEANIKAALARNWQHLVTMDAIARGHGAATLFSTFQFYEGNDSVSRLVNGTLREVFGAHAIEYVDQDALIPDYDRALQFDECHFTRAGDERMAENFFRRIAQEGFLQRHP